MKKNIICSYNDELVRKTYNTQTNKIIENNLECNKCKSLNKNCQEIKFCYNCVRIKQSIYIYERINKITKYFEIDFFHIKNEKIKRREKENQNEKLAIKRDQQRKKEKKTRNNIKK